MTPRHRKRIEKMGKLENFDWPFFSLPLFGLRRSLTCVSPPYDDSHAAFGDLRGHKESFDGVDIEIVVDRVRRQLALWTVKGIRIVIAINGRHFNVTRCDGLRFWRGRDSRRVSWERWQNGCRVFEASILIDKLIILKRLARHSYEIRLIFGCSYIRVDSSICPFAVRFVICRRR
jgi:hypothetical protein